MLTRQIEENKGALEAIRKIRELEARGEFDAANEEHATLLETAGISQNDYNSDREKALNERTRELNRENERLEAERAANTRRIETLRAERDRILDSGASNESKDAALEEVVADIREARADNNADWRNQVDIESHEGVSQKDVRILDAADRAIPSSPEDEVATFMQDLAEAGTIEDRTARLTREQELVDSLSAKAAEMVSWSEDTEHLFEDGYFDPLDSDTSGNKDPAPVVPGAAPG